MFRFADVPASRPGEGAALVAEEFALKVVRSRVVVQRVAVHQDERLVLAVGKQVDAAGRVLLACPGFPADEDGRFGVRDVADSL